MIPTKTRKYSSRTGKMYEHFYTKEEQRKIVEAELEGKSTQNAIREIVETLTDDDWQEVTD